MDHNFLKLDCSSSKESRLVYKLGENPKPPETGDIDRRLDALGTKVAWNKANVVQDYNNDVAAGREPGYQPKPIPEVSNNMDKPIDPTKENIDYLKAELVKIFREVLPTRYAALYSGGTIDQYSKLLQDMPEGLVMKAVTENGSPKELLDRFRTELRKISEKANNEEVFWVVWHKIRDFFNWVIFTGKWDLEGSNPNLNDKPNVNGEKTVKPHHKVFLTNGMIELEKYYKERIEDKQGHWYGDNYDNDKKDFLESIELPFYREYYLNKAILNKGDAAQLAEDYSQFLVKAYRDCMTDLRKRLAQETDDLNNEKQERSTRGDAYFNAITKITGAVIMK